MVLYRPREEQRYYYGADQTEVYWVHFTGNNVKNFLRRYGIADDTRIIYTGISIEYKNLFMSMIEELNLQRIDYEEMLINYFMILLISLHRIALQKPRKKNLQNMNDMEQAAQYFRMQYEYQLVHPELPSVCQYYICSIRAVSEAYQCKNASGNDQL